MGSTNGTFVNGERISGSRRLLPGDTVKVGATVMQVLDESGRRPQPTTFSTVPSFDAPPSQYDTVASTAPYQEPPPRHATPVQPRQEEPQTAAPRTGRLAAGLVSPYRCCFSRPPWSP